MLVLIVIGMSVMTSTPLFFTLGRRSLRLEWEHNRAAAQVAGQCFLDLFIAGLRIVVQQSPGRHQQARVRSIAARRWR